MAQGTPHLKSVRRAPAITWQAAQSRSRCARCVHSCSAQPNLKQTNPTHARWVLFYNTLFFAICSSNHLPRLLCRSGSGRLSFREFRGGGELMDALYALDREDDINKVGAREDGRMDS